MVDRDLTLGQKIRYFRKRKGMSQLDLETKINTSSGSISRIENGQVNPTKETLCKIIESLDIPSNEATTLFGINVLRNLISYEAAYYKNIDDYLTNVLDIILGTKDLALVSILLWNEGKKELRVVKTSIPKNIERFVEKVLKVKMNEVVYPVKAKPNVFAKVIETKELQISLRLRDELAPLLGRTSSRILEQMTRKFMNSFAVSPLMIKDEVIGLITFGRNSSTLTELDKAILNTFSKQVANAIYNSELWR